MSGVHEISDLRQMQALPLHLKVMLTKQRIREWIREFGEDGVYVSFSGGKDSTVLLDIVRQDYPNVRGMFVDTGLEFPEIREFVRSVPNVDWVKPKLTFKQVLQKYGYPMISKEVSECVYGARKYLKELQKQGIVPNDLKRERETDYRTGIGTIKCAEQASMLNPTRGGAIANSESYAELANILNERIKSRARGSNQRLAIMLGMFTNNKENPIQASIPKTDKSKYSCTKWKFLLFAPDWLPISNQCCSAMKKSPAHKYYHDTGRCPITGQMAAESRVRTQQWLKFGCNGFNNKIPTSNPMSFWTEQDVLLYIKNNGLKIASVYGDIVYDNGEELDGQMSFADFGLMGEKRKLKTTGCDRTGCMFCGFGAHMKDDERYVRLKQTHPKVYEYIMKPVDEGGLGFKDVIDWLNENGGLHIKY